MSVQETLTQDPVLTEAIGKMEMIGTLGESSHAVSEFDLNSVLPMQTQMVLMSRKTGRKPKKPACHTGTR